MSSQHLYSYTPLDFSRPPPVEEIMTGRDARWFLELCVKIPTQRGIKPFVLYPWMHQVAYEGLADRQIMLKSREIGSTTFWTALLLREVLTHPGANLLIAADKEENAVNAIRYVKTMVENLPDQVRPKTGKYNETTVEFPGLGNYIKALPGTPKAGRAERALYLLATEQAFWEQDSVYWNAVTGALVEGGTIVIESTANGPEGLFHDIWHAQDNDYAKHFWGWTANPEHTPEWYQRRRKDIPDRFLFIQEYPETAEQAFIGSADSYFDPDVVAAGQEEVRRPVEESVIGKDLGWIHTWKKPLPGAHYVIGADVAEGKASSKDDNPDWSDATILDWATGEHVATIHTRVTEDEYAALLHQYAKEYNNAHLAVERNGPGNGVLMWLRAKGYDNLYYEVSLVDEVRGMVRQAKKFGWTTNENTKGVMLMDLYAAIKAYHFRSPDALFWSQAKVINRATKRAMGKQKDDKVVSAAIAWQAKRKYNPARDYAAAGTVDEGEDGRSWVGMW